MANEQFFHEVIDYRFEPVRVGDGYSLRHHFFGDEISARAWIEDHTDGAQQRLVYQYRAWGAPALAAASITWHFDPKTPPREKTWEVSVRGSIHATQTVKVEAATRQAAEHLARKGVSENPMTKWSLSEVWDIQIDGTEELPDEAV